MNYRIADRIDVMAIKFLWPIFSASGCPKTAPIHWNNEYTVSIDASWPWVGGAMVLMDRKWVLNINAAISGEMSCMIHR